MLTEDRLADMMRRGEISLRYHWDPRQQPPALLPDLAVDPADVDRPATQAFRTNFFGDRLGLTLGPLILSHRYARLRGRKNFQDFPAVFDLRETGDRIVIRSGESLTVNTIEHVTLGGSLAAITLPRLT